jgi:hypothetical protein
MLLEARDEKPNVIKECRRLEKEIKKIHVLLPDEFRRKIPPIFDLEPDENPEALLDITWEDVDKEEAAMIEAAGLTGIKDEIVWTFNFVLR